MAKGTIQQTIAIDITGLDDVKDVDKRIESLVKKKAKLTVDADTGDASKKLDAINDELDALTKQKTKLILAADTQDAERDLQAIFDLTDKLGSTSANIVLQDNAKTIEREIADLVIKLDGLEDPHDIKITMDQINALESEIGQVDAKLAELGGRPIDIQTGNARKSIDDLGESGNKSKSVLANMVGNTTQDLGALGGVAGSAGVAIGQMGEYMADAAGSGDKLSQIVKGFGGIAVPLVVIGVATAAISDHFTKIAKMAEESDQQMHRMSDSIQEGATEAGVLRKELEAVGELKFNVDIQGTDIAGKDLVGPLAEAGLKLEDFVALSKLSNEEFRRWADGAEKAGVSSDALATISIGLAGYFQQQSSAEANAENNLAILGDTTNAHADAVKAATDATTDFLKANKPMSDMPATWKTAEEAVRGLEQGIKPSADQMQALIVLAQQYGTDVPGVIKMVTDKFGEQEEAAKASGEALQQAGQEAADAQAELNDALNETNDSLDEAAVAAEGFQSALDKIDAGSQLDFSLMAINTVKSFDSIKSALEDAQKAGTDWSKVDLTPESVDELKGITPELEAVTESIHGMRESIQTELTAAFDTGGIQGYRDKATFFAGEIRDQFVQSFKDAGASEDEAVAKTNELLSALGLLPEQVEIQVKLTQAEAARKTLEIFKSDIDKLPADVSTEIKTLWAQGSTVEALGKLNDYLIAHGQPPIDIDSIINPPPALDPADIPTATATVDADTQPAQDAVDLWNANADAAEAQANFDANPDDAEAAVRLWNANANAAKAKATFDANAAQAQSKVDGWEANANAARGTGTMSATAQPANAVVDGWEAATNRTTATATANAKLGTYPSSADIVRAIGPVVVQAKVVALKMFDLAGGGTAPRDGALAGEAGAEFIREPGRSERLLTGPSWVPPGTRVTSARRTRQILARRGGRPAGASRTSIPRALRDLPRYAEGGVVPFSSSTTSIPVTVNINAAVIGSRYEVAKAVGQGTRDLRRLVGARGTRG